MAKQKGRPKGTTKEDSLSWLTVTIGLTKETVQWYKSLPEGTKAKTLRECIDLFRNQNKPENS